MNLEITNSILILEESNASEMAGSSPIIGERHASSGSASPVAVSKTASTDPWPIQTDEDIDRLVALHKVSTFTNNFFMNNLYYDTKKRAWVVHF